MSAAVEYIRVSGPHVAERVRPAAGSAEDTRLAALAADPASNWVRVEPDEPGDEQEPPAPSAPPKSAAKADWIAWAVHCGATPEEAEALTKEQLTEQYAAQEG